MTRQERQEILEIAGACLAILVGVLLLAAVMTWTQWGC